MALFSGNRKVRPRRPPTEQDAIQKLSPHGKAHQLDKRADELRQQIHRLECMITVAPRLQRQRRLANVNMVPPMQLSTPAPRHRRAPLAQRRARRGERLRMVLESVLVLGCIAAVTGWLNQWFHFWA